MFKFCIGKYFYYYYYYYYHCVLNMTVKYCILDPAPLLNPQPFHFTPYYIIRRTKRLIYIIINYHLLYKCHKSYFSMSFLFSFFYIRKINFKASRHWHFESIIFLNSIFITSIIYILFLDNIICL